MVRQFYAPQITELSEQELQAVVEAATPPVCLLGGWAVHLHVNPGFSDEHGRQYIGSRDIDLGIHVDPDWTREELLETPVGETIAGIQELGYTKSRFGFVQHFLRDSQERIDEKIAAEHQLHEVFQVYIDILPDTIELSAFKDAFGFEPPAEPLLRHVFEAGRGEPLSDHVSWSPPDDVLIVPSALLAAMKIRAIPERDKSHKRVKDVADLHALLWYVTDYAEIKNRVMKYVSESDLERVNHSLDGDVIENAAQLLQIDTQLLSETINRLSHPET